MAVIPKEEANLKGQLKEDAASKYLPWYRVIVNDQGVLASEEL